MGLIDCASGNSLWRGYDYFKEKRVTALLQIGESIFEANVSGSNRNPYHVVVDIPHPRKSKCNCPHADGKRIICKHIVAAYFTVHPEEAEHIYREAMEYEAEEKKRQEEIAAKLPSLIHKMKKGALETALLQVLYDGPEWQYDKFLRDYFDIY